MDKENKFIAVFHHARHDDWWREGDCRLIHLMTPELLAERGLKTFDSMDLVELEALDIPAARIAANEILPILCEQRGSAGILRRSRDFLDNLNGDCNDDLSDEISSLKEDEEMVKKSDSEEVTEKIVSIRKGKGGKAPKFLHMKEAEGFDPDDYSDEVVHVNVGRVDNLEAAKKIAWAAYNGAEVEVEEEERSPTPARGSQVVMEEMEAALKGGRADVNVEDLILQFLRQNPASAKRLAKKAAEPHVEPEIRVHFELGEISVGKYGMRKKVFVTSSLKRAPAKIGLATFMTILNNPEEARKFAHENGLVEKAGGEEDEEENGVDVVQSARTASLPAKGRILQAK